MPSGTIAYVRQNKALGLGHAVWCARRLIADEPFAVILPDDVIAADVACLAQMTEAYADTGGCMVAAMAVPPEKTSAYGVLDVAETSGNLVSVRGMVEKPEAENAPSNLAVIGRYILTPDVLEALDRQQAGAGGEIQLTDAIAAMIAQNQPVHGLASRASASTAVPRRASFRRRSPSAWRGTTCATSSTATSMAFQRWPTLPNDDDGRALEARPSALPRSRCAESGTVPGQAAWTETPEVRMA